MAEPSVKQQARDILTRYLALNNQRKTTERYAILDAIYSHKGHFTLDELSDLLERENFPVSRATLYNTMRLFIEMRLVVRHRFIGQTKYEACYMGDSHVHQVCTVCGRVTELDATDVARSIEVMRLQRFHKDGFTLYIYGVCSACHKRLARQMGRKAKAEGKENKQKQDKQ